MILELKKIKSVAASTFSASICYEVIGPGAMIVGFCFFLVVLVLRCCAGFSLVAASGDFSLAAVRQLLIAVASLAVEPRLQRMQASGVVGSRLSNCGTQA